MSTIHSQEPPNGFAAVAPATRLAKWTGLSPVTAVFLIVLVDVLGFTIILPLLPFYAQRFGAGPAIAGGLYATYAACQLISGPLLGRLSDRVGRKPLLLVSQLGTLLSFLMLAWAPSLTWLFLARVLDGLTAGNISLAQAVISDVTPPEGRAKAFGKLGIAFGVGFLIGPALAGWLAQFSYVAPIFAGAALSAGSILATVLLLPADQARSAPAHRVEASPLTTFRSFGHYFRQPRLRLRLSQFFLFILSFALYTSCFPLFAAHRLTVNGQPFGPSEVAYVLAYGGLLGIILQGALISRLVDRFGDEPLIGIGFASLAVGFVILGLSYTLSITLVAATFVAIGHGLSRPILTSSITRAADRSEQGTVLGVSQSMQSIAQILAPLAGGLLIEKDLTTPWALLAAFAAALGVVLEVRREKA